MAHLSRNEYKHLLEALHIVDVQLQTSIWLRILEKYRGGNFSAFIPSYENVVYCLPSSVHVNS